jgi:signal transduction histidine kinase
MRIWDRVKNSGYRFRVYLFAGLLVFLVMTSLAFTFGVSWYSKNLFGLIVEKDLKARETERTLVDLLVSMDRNRKKYFLLEKPEYGRMFREDSRSFRKQLARLEELGLSEEEAPTFLKLREKFEHYLHKDPFVAGEDPSAIDSVSDLPLEEVRLLLGDLLELNQERMDLRITQMNRLEQRAFQVVFLGAVISLLAAGILSYLLIRSITRPIDLLRKGTQEIAEGKFMHRVDFSTKGELGDLADSFNEMADRLRKLDEMKADFMALVSHELKTPLTSMKEAVGLMLEEAVGPISPKQKRLLLINAAGIEKLTRFVEDILNLTTMEGGLTPLYLTRFDLQELLQGKLDTFRLLADKKKIRLSATCKPDPLPPVVADAERLKQVFANLLNNAIFFTPPGGEVSIRVESVQGKSLPVRMREASKAESSKQWLKIEFSDTGEGIPKEEWNRVFDKFHQIKKSSNHGSGSGLGLAIAKHIVEAHGGSICVENSSGGGTTFVIVIPQSDVPKEKTRRDEVSTSRLQPQNP